MTREEANNELERAFDVLDHSCHMDNRRKEAFNMARVALSTEPCEDCISRQAVNELVDELARAISDERCCMSRGRSTGTIMQDILDLLSVTPNQTELLDKIRAEIEGYKSTIDNAISEDELKIEGMKEAYANCLEIIDKYKAESEGKE